MSIVLETCNNENCFTSWNALKQGKIIGHIYEFGKRYSVFLANGRRIGGVFYSKEIAAKELEKFLNNKNLS